MTICNSAFAFYCCCCCCCCCYFQETVFQRTFEIDYIELIYQQQQKQNKTKKKTNKTKKN